MVAIGSLGVASAMWLNVAVGSNPRYPVRTGRSIGRVSLNQMTIHEYIENISLRYASGITTEHSFRGDLQQLLESLVPEIRATNEPKRIECGAPDYVITRKDIPVGYIEAKDVGVDLDGKNLKEQFDRYRDALDNLVFTDYLDFRFYLNGELTTSVKIAGTQNGRIVSLPENFEQFTSLIKQFCSRTPQTIKSSKKLAEMMAEKAKILAFIIKNALDEDVQSEENSTLREQMKAFKDILIHDIDAKAFADIYAQTIAYGMFAARLHDKNLDTFSRREAAELIPKTNPFLRKLFQYIAGFDLDTRIDWIVDALADLFRATDIAAILKNFGKSTQTHDPIMHFYETFLAEYDPKLRKSRGVFYTPEPVVDFIVRAVDDILKSEFNLPNGIADTSKTKIKVDVQGKIREQEVHKVQILDPATGTGTFLASVIKHIYKGFENQQGIWNQYVDEHLIPRLNGFELLMASYAMAHLKLDLLLTELSESPAVAGGTVQKPAREQGRNTQLPDYALVNEQASANPRFQIYLTNALEEYHPDTGTLFASWLSTEANEANHIKRDTPVMVVIGNPPYSGESANKGEWIMSLMDDYKKEPGGIEKLKERNPKWINDDYVKFLRYGQHFIEKNGEGVLAFINPHGFLDNPTFRGMRWNLLKTYDKIYVLDLHGNSKKGETCPDGSKDENVFDIQQGVSINILVKTGKKAPTDLGQLLHADIYGKRDTKYDFLSENSLETSGFKHFPNVAPNYFIMPKDFALEVVFNEGFSIVDLYPLNNVGVVSANDGTLVNFERNGLLENVTNYYQITPLESSVEPIAYRPFDERVIYYDTKLIERARENLMKHFLSKHTDGNVGLNWIRPMSSKYEFSIFIANTICDQCSAGNKSAGAGISYIAPIYCYQNDNAQQTLDGRTERVPNLNSEIVERIAAAIGLTFVAEKGGNPTGRAGVPTASVLNAAEQEDTLPTGRVSASDADDTFAPIDILDYIYAVLHSPSYREKYKEFLKIDFPRVPYPKDATTFWQLVALGGELRQIHLLESSVVSKPITGFPVGGDNTVAKIAYTDGRVFFNDTQYFDGVPETAWNFYIGGYQPAQKWLKDRKGRKLKYDEIQHYQKIIVALTETARLMKEIDGIDLTD
jgi:predicted helicase